jgi:hypothetical protein
LSNLYTNITNNLTDKQNKRNNGEILSLNLNQEKDMDKRMSPDGTRKLQDEINTLTKRNCELESQLRSLEAGHSKDIFIDTLDGAESGKCTIHVENKYFK